MSTVLKSRIKRYVPKKATTSRMSMRKRVKKSNTVNTSISRLPEVKVFDKFATVTITQSGAISLLSAITTLGTGEGQRIGNKIFLRTLWWHATFIRNASSSFDTLRVMIIMDKQGYNTPALTDIFEPGTLGSGFAPLSKLNENYLPRFKVLYDNNLYAMSTQHDTYTLGLRIDINTAAYYISSSTFKGQIYVVFIGDNGNVLTLPYVNFVSRISYNDS